MSKRPFALLLAITGNVAFAAGCVLQALHRHSPQLNVDIILFTDQTVPAKDAALLTNLGARLLPFTPPDGAFPTDAVQTFSLMTLARFEALLLLKQYHTVAWLDIDIAIQGDIAPLFAYGPFAMAQEDPWFTGGTTSLTAINVSAPIPDLDMHVPNLNAGVFVMHDTLPHPDALHAQCMQWLKQYAEHLKYLDQPILNMLAQYLQREDPLYVARLPHDVFNAHPTNPAAQHAVIVHAFGAYKLWDDGLTRCAFPEWSRDDNRWLALEHFNIENIQMLWQLREQVHAATRRALGGTPWAGTVENQEFLDGGAFFMLRRFYDNMAKAQKLIESQQARLEQEQRTRLQLEKLVQHVAVQSTQS